KETLAALDLFGLQEHFDEFCGELQTWYGLDVGPPLRANTTEPEDVPPGLAERIADDNALDIELYEYARALYDERRRGAWRDGASDASAGTGASPGRMRFKKPWRLNVTR